MKETDSQLKKVFPVAFATNEAYAPYMSVAIQSLIDHAAADNDYRVYVLYSQLNEETKQTLNKMSTSNVRVELKDMSKFVADTPLYVHSHFSVETYYRFWLPKLFKEYDKVLYLDCDMLVRADVAELFNYDLGDNYIGACRDLLPKNLSPYITDELSCQPENYFNAGLTMFNVSAWQEHGLYDKCMEKLNQFRNLQYLDQDILNMVCNGKVYYFDFYWNVMWSALMQTSENICLSGKNKEAFLNCQKSADRIKLIHYTSGRKPWNEGLYCRYAGLWLKCAEKSPFFAGKPRISYKLFLGCFLPVRTIKHISLWGCFPYSFNKFSIWLKISYGAHSCRMKLFGHLCLYKIKCSEQKVIHLLFGFLPILCLKRM